MLNTSSWSEERVTLLRQLWQDGLSCAQIARRLGGLTRNAVIGKVSRLKLPPRSGPRGSGRSTSERQNARPPRRPGLVMRPRFEALDPEQLLAQSRANSATAAGPIGGVQLLDLEPHHCRWPIGDPKQAGFHFCGAGKAHGSYCAAHAVLSLRQYEPVTAATPIRRVA